MPPYPGTVMEAAIAQGGPSRLEVAVAGREGGCGADGWSRGALSRFAPLSWWFCV